MEIVSRAVYLESTEYTNRYQRETHVLPTNLPSHPRNTKIQHSRLSSSVRLFPHSFLACYLSISSMEQFQKAIRKVRQVQRMRKQRGYAFSQADEGQSRLIQAYDTTKERGRYGEMQSVRPGH